MRTLTFLICIFLVFGCESEDESCFQESPHAWGGFTEELIKDLCEHHGIDHELEYTFTCPKCCKGGAFIRKSKLGSTYYNFILNYPILEELKPGETYEYSEKVGQSYCGKCRYPVGTDWKILEPNQQTLKSRYAFFSTLCKCGNHMKGPYDKENGYWFQCARCERIYAWAWDERAYRERFDEGTPGHLDWGQKEDDIEMDGTGLTIECINLEFPDPCTVVPFKLIEDEPNE